MKLFMRSFLFLVFNFLLNNFIFAASCSDEQEIIEILGGSKECPSSPYGERAQTPMPTRKDFFLASPGQLSFPPKRELPQAPTPGSNDSGASPELVSPELASPELASSHRTASSCSPQRSPTPIVTTYATSKTSTVSGEAARVELAKQNNQLGQAPLLGIVCRSGLEARVLQVFPKLKEFQGEIFQILQSVFKDHIITTQNLLPNGKGTAIAIAEGQIENLTLRINRINQERGFISRKVKSAYLSLHQRDETFDDNGNKKILFDLVFLNIDLTIKKFSAQEKTVLEKIYLDLESRYPSLKFYLYPCDEFDCDMLTIFCHSEDFGGQIADYLKQEVFKKGILSRSQHAGKWAHVISEESEPYC